MSLVRFDKPLDTVSGLLLNYFGGLQRSLGIKPPLFMIGAERRDGLSFSIYDF